ncbi:MAG: response regulator [Clostridiales bacterium]|nr:response regulator [Clostridiales bacterium]
MRSIQQTSVLVADADAGSAARIRGALFGLGADLAGCTDSGLAAVQLAEKQLPDVLLLSLTIAELDGLAVLGRMKRLLAGRMPAVIAMAPRGMDGYLRRAVEMGACRAVVKPLPGGDLAAAIEALTPCDRLCPDWAERDRVRDLLTRLRVPAHMKGYQYLCDAVCLAARDERLARSPGAQLYPAVARRRDTTPNLVERSIRSAIEAAWSVGDVDDQYAFFGNAIDAGRGKPTNSAFIARVAEDLRMGES